MIAKSDQVSPTLTTFLFEAANFLLLAGLLGWLFFKPVRQALEQQRESIDAAAHEAEQKLAEAEETRGEIEAQRRALQQELEQLRAHELEAARQKAERIVADARATAEREREVQAQQAARRAESESVRLSRAAASAAAEVVARLLEQIEGPDLETALVKAACEQVRAMPRHDLAPVRVESAQPLSEPDRALLREAVGQQAGDQQITWQVLPELGPGLRITTGRGLIDATADGLAQYAQRALLAELNHRDSNTAPLT